MDKEPQKIKKTVKTMDVVGSGDVAQKISSPGEGEGIETLQQAVPVSVIETTETTETLPSVEVTGKTDELITTSEVD